MQRCATQKKRKSVGRHKSRKQTARARRQLILNTTCTDDKKRNKKHNKLAKQQKHTIGKRCLPRRGRDLKTRKVRGGSWTAMPMSPLYTSVSPGSHTNGSDVALFTHNSDTFENDLANFTGVYKTAPVWSANTIALTPTSQNEQVASYASIPPSIPTSTEIEANATETAAAETAAANTTAANTAADTTEAAAEATTTADTADAAEAKAAEAAKEAAVAKAAETAAAAKAEAEEAAAKAEAEEAAAKAEAEEAAAAAAAKAAETAAAAKAAGAEVAPAAPEAAGAGIAGAGAGEAAAAAEAASPGAGAGAEAEAEAAEAAEAAAAAGAGTGAGAGAGAEVAPAPEAAGAAAEEAEAEEAAAKAAAKAAETAAAAKAAGAEEAAAKAEAEEAAAKAEAEEAAAAAKAAETAAAAKAAGAEEAAAKAEAEEAAAKAEAEEAAAAAAKAAETAAAAKAAGAEEAAAKAEAEEAAAKAEAEEAAAAAAKAAGAEEAAAKAEAEEAAAAKAVGAAAAAATATVAIGTPDQEEAAQKANEEQANKETRAAEEDKSVKPGKEFFTNLLHNFKICRPPLQRQSVFHPKNGARLYKQIKRQIHLFYFEVKKSLLDVELMFGPLTRYERRQHCVMIGAAQISSAIPRIEGIDEDTKVFIATQLTTAKKCIADVYELILKCLFNLFHTPTDNATILKYSIHQLDTLCTSHKFFKVPLISLLVNPIHVSVKQILDNSVDHITEVCKVLFLQKLVNQVETFIKYTSGIAIYNKITMAIIKCITDLFENIHEEKYRTHTGFVDDLYTAIFECFSFSNDSFIGKVIGNAFSTFRGIADKIVGRFGGELWKNKDIIYDAIRSVLVSPKELVFAVQTELTYQTNLNVVRSSMIEKRRNSYANIHTEFCTDSDSDYNDALTDLNNAEKSTRAVLDYHSELCKYEKGKTDLLATLTKTLEQIKHTQSNEQILELGRIPPDTVDLNLLTFSPLQLLIIFVHPLHISVNNTNEVTQRTKILPALYHLQTLQAIDSILTLLAQNDDDDDDKTTRKSHHRRFTLTNFPKEIQDMITAQRTPIDDANIDKLVTAERKARDGGDVGGAGDGDGGGAGGGDVGGATDNNNGTSNNTNILYRLYQTLTLKKPLLDRLSVVTEAFYTHKLKEIQTQNHTITTTCNEAKDSILGLLTVVNLNIHIPKTITIQTTEQIENYIQNELKPYVTLQFENITKCVNTLVIGCVHITNLYLYTITPPQPLLTQIINVLDTFANTLICGIPISSYLQLPIRSLLIRLAKPSELFYKVVCDAFYNCTVDVSPKWLRFVTTLFGLTNFFLNKNSFVINTLFTTNKIERFNKIMTCILKSVISVSIQYLSELHTIMNFDVKQFLGSVRDHVATAITGLHIYAHNPTVIETFLLRGGEYTKVYDNADEGKDFEEIQPKIYDVVPLLVTLPINDVDNTIRGLLRQPYVHRFVNDMINSLNKSVGHICRLIDIVCVVPADVTKLLVEEVKSQRVMDKFLVETVLGSDTKNMLHIDGVHGKNLSGSSTQKNYINLKTGKQSMGASRDGTKTCELKTRKRTLTQYQTYYDTLGSEATPTAAPTHAYTTGSSLLDYAPIQILAAFLSSYHIQMTDQQLSTANCLLPLQYHLQKLGLMPPIYSSDPDEQNDIHASSKDCLHVFNWNKLAVADESKVIGKLPLTPLYATRCGNVVEDHRIEILHNIDKRRSRESSHRKSAGGKRHSIRKRHSARPRRAHSAKHHNHNRTDTPSSDFVVVQSSSSGGGDGRKRLHRTTENHVEEHARMGITTPRTPRNKYTKGKKYTQRKRYT
jgi:hypothetical protein